MFFNIACFFHGSQVYQGTSRLTRGGSRAASTSKMERFVIIVNGGQYPSREAVNDFMSFQFVNSNV